MEIVAEMIANEVIIRGMTIVLVPAAPELDLGAQIDTDLTNLSHISLIREHLQPGHIGSIVVILRKDINIKLQ
ncbi:outer membrane lipoprotein carrier protein LolA [Sesbania bispinosa]|nr:outer membrane lipoprotein carrier protein LolA [Sesbania bispinosa]